MYEFPKKRTRHMYTGDDAILYPDDFTGDLNRAEFDDQTAMLMAKRRKAMQRYKGDSDKDFLSDSVEIEVGLHSADANKPLHEIRRYGPTTPGSAKAVMGRGIEWEWDNSIINLKVKPFKTPTGSRPYTMPSPKPLKLDIEFGDGHRHVNAPGGYRMKDMDVHPEKFTLNLDGVKPLGIKKVVKRVGKAKPKQKVGIMKIGDMSFDVLSIFNGKKGKKGLIT